MALKKPNIQIVLQDLDENDLGSVIRTFNDVQDFIEEFTNKRDKLEQHLIKELKNRGWDSFIDEQSKISVNITNIKKEKVNKNVLKMLLNEEQYNNAINNVNIEKIQLVTPQIRDKLKKNFK